MLERVLMAGSGGQGIISLGKLLASTALELVPHITFYPAYGAQVRGGTSHCQVIMSSEPIASPVADISDAVIIMNQASADRFLPRCTQDTRIFINSSLCNAGDVSSAVLIDASELAVKLGDTRAANMIMLGAYVASAEFISPDNIEATIRSAFTAKGERVVDLNISALRQGMAL